MPKRLNNLLIKEFSDSVSTFSDIAVSEEHKECSCKKEAFHFDKIKISLCSSLGISTPKSCDCLMIDEKNNTIKFIEFKSLEKEVLHNRHKFQKREDYEKYYGDLIKNKGLDNKIIDSYILLFTLLWKYNLEKDLHVSILESTNIKIKYYVVLDVSHSDLVSFDLSLQDIKYRLKYRFLNFVDITNSDSFCKS